MMISAVHEGSMNYHQHSLSLFFLTLPIAYAVIFSDKLKPTIHEATFAAGDTAKLLLARAAHEKSNATF